MAGDSSFLSSTRSAVLPTVIEPSVSGHAERVRAAHRGLRYGALRLQAVDVDRLARVMGLEVVARPERAQRRAHRRKEVGAPPHAGVRRERRGDAVFLGDSG